MRMLRLAGLAMLTLIAAVPLPASAQEDRVATRGNAAEREEIARILAADNLDASRLDPTQIAAAIRAIPRGSAPTDFWAAYQAHVQAWVRFAELFQQVTNLGEGDGKLLAGLIAEAEGAEEAIGRTFTEVERIATGYGVDMPAPPIAANALPTT